MKTTEILTGSTAHKVENYEQTSKFGLSFKPHIDNATKTAFFHLRNIAKVRPHHTLHDAKQAFVFSCWIIAMHCSLAYLEKNTDKLQLVQNAAARILT